MITISENAYAKINLTLDILGKRPDGYHDIETIMHPISLCDVVDITLGTGTPWQVVTDWDHIPHGRKNIAYKAAKLFFDKAEIDPNGMTIEITKRIPDEGGLGGGSADAGAVLRGLNSHYDNKFTTEKLEAMALELGSDVPFFIQNRTVLAEGRGEKMTPVTPMPQCFYVLVQPDFKCATGELYKKASNMNFPARPDTKAMLAAMEAGNLKEIGSLFINVFQFPAMLEHRNIEQLENALENCGSLGTSMTGSGSVIFGIFETFELAAMASMSLMEVGLKTMMATNL